MQEARENLTAETAASLPSKWTKDELDGLERTLREHEAWLSEWVEKQKSVKANENPVIETTEMKARAKVLETHLHKLWKRRVPKKPVVVSSSATSATTTTAATATAGVDDDNETTVEEDILEGDLDDFEEGGEQIPMTETRPAQHDEL